jgi:hypothetical protein
MAENGEGATAAAAAAAATAAGDNYYDFSQFDEFFNTKWLLGRSRFEEICFQLPRVDFKSEFIDFYHVLRMKRDNRILRYMYLGVRYVRKNPDIISNCYEGYILAKNLLLEKIDSGADEEGGNARKTVRQFVARFSGKYERDETVKYFGSPQLLFDTFTSEALRDFFSVEDILDFRKAHREYNLRFSRDSNKFDGHQFEDRDTLFGKDTIQVIAMYWGTVFLVKIVYLVTEGIQTSFKDFYKDFAYRYNVCESMNRCGCFKYNIFELDYLIMYKEDLYRKVACSLRESISFPKSDSTDEPVSDTQTCEWLEGGLVLFSEKFKNNVLNKRLYETYVAEAARARSLYQEFMIYHNKIVFAVDSDNLSAEFVDMVRNLRGQMLDRNILHVMRQLEDLFDCDITEQKQKQKQK